MLDFLVGRAHALSRVLVWFGGALLIGAAGLVTFEVVIRKLFNMSLGGADELAGYAFGMATTLSLSYALFERAHIRVDALYHHLPGWLRRAADFLGLLLLTGFVAIIAVMATQLFADTVTHGSRSITPLRTPLVIPQSVWLLGWLLCVVSGLLLLLAAAAALLRGDRRRVQVLIGIKSTEEQIEDEAP